MILVIAQLRRTGTPHIAIAAIFSPPCLIHLHRWASANLLLHLGQLRLQPCFDALRKADDLATTDRETVQTGQIGFNLAHWRTHHRPQMRNQAGNLRSQSALPHHLPAYVQRGFSPRAPTSFTTVVDHMLCHARLMEKGAASSITWRRRATLIPPRALYRAPDNT